MRHRNFGIFGLTAICLVIASSWCQMALGCEWCVPSGKPRDCSQLQSFLYGWRNVNKSAQYPGEMTEDPKKRDVFYDPQVDPDMMALVWDTSWEGNTGETVIKCFLYDETTDAFWCTDDQDVMAFGLVDEFSGMPYIVGADWTVAMPGSCHHYTAEGINDWTYAEVSAIESTFDQGKDHIIQRTLTEDYDDDGQNDLDWVEVQRSTTTVRKTYYEYTLDNSHLVRKRKTVVEPLLDGNIYLTTIYVYYSPGHDYAGKLWFVVEPEGLARFLADAGYDKGIDPDNPDNTCSLENRTSVPDETAGGVIGLKGYAARIYNSYDDDGYVTSMTGSGCGGCGGAGGIGSYTYKYGTNDSYNPSGEEQIRNTWKTFRGTQMPNGQRRIQFINVYDQVVFDVVQSAIGETTSAWITHYVYYHEGDGRGQVKEKRHPSACEAAGYTFGTDAGGWINSITTATTANDGLVELFDYYSSGMRKSEKIRKGVTGTSDYWVRKYTYSDNTNALGINIYKVASVKEYTDETTNEAGAGNTTTYDYSYHGTTNAVEEETVTYPTVTTDNNGSGRDITVVRHFKLDDTNGLYYNDWTQHEDGRFSYTKLGIGTWDHGQVVLSVEDATSSTDSPGNGFPSGWETGTSGLELETGYTYHDAIGSWGRLESVTSPGGQKAVYAYVHQYEEGGSSPTKETTTRLVTLSTPHMDGDDDYDYAPVQITVSDLAGRTVISATGVPTYDEDGDLAGDWNDGDGDEDIEDAFVGSINSKSINNYNDEGQLTSSDRYYVLDAVTPANEKKLTTTYSYHPDTGRMYMTETSDGTATWTDVDSLGRVTKTYVGTVKGDADEDDPGTLRKVSATEYDNNDVGDGLVTKTKSYRDDNNSYDTVYKHDFRGRRTGARGPDGVASVSELDNLGRAKKVEVFKESGTPNFQRDSGEDYLSVTKTDYDERGQVCRSLTYKIVDGETTDEDLADSVRMTTKYWYDERGRQIKTENPNGLFSKQAYDGVGRVTGTYVCHETGEEYDDANNVEDDTVIEQTKPDYDDLGRVWRVRSFRRYENGTGYGELGSSNSVITYTVYWHDELGRQTKGANYGTTEVTSLPDPEPDPGDSADVIVTQTDYSGATGRVTATYDNKNRKTTREYDPLGRTTSVIENDVETPAGADEDRTTEYAYDARGRMARITAKNSTTGHQKTYYFFCDTDSDTGNNNQASGSLVTAVVYPDSDDVIDDDLGESIPLCTLTSGSNHVAYDYDRLGRKHTTTDQRQVEHTYSYSDTTGRLESDTVTGWPTTIPLSLDDTVKRISYGYDDLGRIETISSSSDTDGDPVINEVKFTYGAWGVVSGSTQDHENAVSSGEPAVSYEYEDDITSNEAKFVRLDYVEYPGPSTARKVYYNYSGSGVGAVLSRLDNIAGDASGTQKYSSYTYLGASTVIKVEYPAVTSGSDALALSFGSGGSYSGFDKFGRVVDQKWRFGTSGTIVDQYKYGYDYTGNRLWRDVMPDTGSPPTNLDHYYGYDGLDRLTKSNRGNLSSEEITDAAAVFNQAWTLDPVGNWGEFQWDADGGGNSWTEQSRAHNKANEIEGNGGDPIYGSGAADWLDPEYDAAGNMTAGPMPGDETESSGTLHFYTYDAWNRMTLIVEDDGDGSRYDGANPDSGDTDIAEYEYDGLNRRIRKTLKVPNPDVRYDYYYNESWQVLEVRKGQGADPLEQFVWGAQYIDAPVVRFYDGDTDGFDPEEDEDDNVLYYTYDGNFNVTALIGTDGTVAERYTYDPYGKVTFKNPDWSDATLQSKSAYDNEILYCGYRFDPESGLFQVRNRYLHPTLGRWTTTDLIGYGDGMNLYQYGGSSPTGSIDPSGQIVLGMGGLWELGRKEIKEICDAIVQQINAKKPGLRGGKEFPTDYSGSGGRHMPEVRQEVEDFKTRKDDDPCWHEQIVLIGFSDGATSIWKDFNDGQYQKRLVSAEFGGSYNIAYVGLIDMVRTSFNIFREGGGLKYAGMRNKPRVPFDDGGLVLKERNFYQLNRIKQRPDMPGQPWEVENPNVAIDWTGHADIGKLPSTEVYGVSHKGHLTGLPFLGDWGHVVNPNEPPSIMLDAGMRSQIIAEAVDAYLSREQGDPRNPRNPIVD